jgi:hypothetical protein
LVGRVWRKGKKILRGFPESIKQRRGKRKGRKEKGKGEENGEGVKNSRVNHEGVSKPE